MSQVFISTSIRKQQNIPKNKTINKSTKVLHYYLHKKNKKRKIRKYKLLKHRDNIFKSKLPNYIQQILNL